jgi:hypothetical protein
MRCTSARWYTARGSEVAYILRGVRMPSFVLARLRARGHYESSRLARILPGTGTGSRFACALTFARVSAEAFDLGRLTIGARGSLRVAWIRQERECYG